MKQIGLATAAILILSSPVFAMADADCTTMWKQADVNSDGTLDATESERYAAMMRIANKPLTSGTAMSEAMFMENCKSDIFAVAITDPAAPLEGANSFTEDQAKDRIISMGMTAPSTMTKDDKGIWRGTATKDGKSANVAVDYKGNVVAK